MGRRGTAGARRAWPAVLLAAGVVLAVAGCAGPRPAVTPSVSSSASAVTLVPTPTATGRRALLTLPAHPRLAVIGDSYLAGVGTTDRATKSFGHLLVGDLGWPALLDGEAGTGFTTGGGFGADGAYPVRADALTRQGFEPNLVVLEGGQNDAASAPAAVRDAVARTVRRLRSAEPVPAVVVLGPAAPWPAASRLRAIDATLARAAVLAGVPYISPIREDWFTPANSPRYGYRDGAHLDDAGYVYFTRRFVQDYGTLFGVADLGSSARG